MKKSTVYVNSKYTKAYIPNSKWTEEGGGGSACCGCLITRHMCGNPAYAHNCTNSSTLPICFIVFFDAL